MAKAASEWRYARCRQQYDAQPSVHGCDGTIAPWKVGSWGRGREEYPIWRDGATRMDACGYHGAQGPRVFGRLSGSQMAACVACVQPRSRIFFVVLTKLFMGEAADFARSR